MNKKFGFQYFIDMIFFYYYYSGILKGAIQI